MATANAAATTALPGVSARGRDLLRARPNVGSWRATAPARSLTVMHDPRPGPHTAVGATAPSNWSYRREGAWPPGRTTGSRPPMEVVDLGGPLNARAADD